MFTGIVQEIGGVIARRDQADLIHFEIDAPYLSEELQIGDSLAVNGVCLTVVEIQSARLTVQVVARTLSCTTLSEIREGDEVNLEPALRLTDRLSGHVMLGHVDGIGVIQNVIHIDDKIEIAVALPRSLKPYVVTKGSIALDGVSLTVAARRRDTVQVAIIPHTAECTTLGDKMVGDKVNVEVDIMGKYIEQLAGRRPQESWMLDSGLMEKIKIPAWPPRGWEQWN